MGCSISATKACKTPWWQMTFPFLKRADGRNEDREACEEAHMQCCVADAQEKCSVYAQDICKESFGDARVVNSGSSFLGNSYRRVKRSSWRDTVWSRGRIIFWLEEAIDAFRDEYSVIGMKWAEVFRSNEDSQLRISVPSIHLSSKGVLWCKIYGFRALFSAQV